MLVLCQQQNPDVLNPIPYHPNSKIAILAFGSSFLSSWVPRCDMAASLTGGKTEAGEIILEVASFFRK
jgi:hypothetical protein